MASAQTLTHVDFADRPKQHTTQRGEDIHHVFDLILQSAHTDYTHKRVHLRAAQDLATPLPKKRGAQHGHQGYQRLLPTRIGRSHPGSTTRHLSDTCRRNGSSMGSPWRNIR